MNLLTLFTLLNRAANCVGAETLSYEEACEELALQTSKLAPKQWLEVINDCLHASFSLHKYPSRFEITTLSYDAADVMLECALEGLGLSKPASHEQVPF